MSLSGVRAAFTVIFFALMMASTLVRANPMPCGKKPIRLAFYSYGAFYFIDANGQSKGVDKEVVDALAQRSGCRFETQLMARARIWADLANGVLDMTVSGVETPERHQFAWFAPYVSFKNYTLVYGRGKKGFQTAEHFLAQPKLKVGVVRGFKHGLEQDRILEQLRLQGRVEESADFETVMKKFKEHRVDAVFIEPLQFHYFNQRFPMQGVELQDWAPQSKGERAGLVLSKRHFSESDARQWQALLREMRDDGTLGAIYSRYLPPSDVRKILEF